MVIVNLVEIAEKGGQVTIHAWPPWQFGGISFHYFLLFPAFAGKLKPKPKQTMHRKKRKINSSFFLRVVCLGFGFHLGLCPTGKGTFSQFTEKWEPAALDFNSSRVDSTLLRTPAALLGDLTQQTWA